MTMITLRNNLKIIMNKIIIKIKNTLMMTNKTI